MEKADYPMEGAEEPDDPEQVGVADPLSLSQRGHVANERTYSVGEHLCSKLALSS